MKPKRKEIEIPQSSVPVENVADEAVYEERDDSLERATTTATGLDAKQDRGNIFKTQSKETPNEPSSIRTSLGGGPRRQDTMRDIIAQTRSENVSKFSNDPLLAGVNTPQSGEDSLRMYLNFQNDKSKVLCAMYSGCSKHMTSNLKLLINFVWKFLGTVHFGNDHVAAILGYGDLQWGNILITRVYFVEGLGHNLFSVRQFYDSDLEVTFKRNTCFVKNLEGVDLLKGDRTTNLYTINLHEMASASLICLMARATSTKSWLWHQRLSHLNFDTINDLARYDLVTGLPKFKYHKNVFVLYVSKEKAKGHLTHPNQTPQQNGVVERRNRTLVEAARTMSIFSRAPLFLWAEAIATACFTQNCSIIHRRFGKTPYELINDKKWISPFYVYSGLFVIPKMIVKILGSLVQKVILASLLVILLIPVLTESTAEGQRKSWR
ncbi:retrovirus-related pol polyprotein from transposon TNT 1-94 [Tanacetum coccineum]